MKKINDQLKAMFDGFSRKIVFWYDDNGEFQERLSELDLGEVKLHFLTQVMGKDKKMRSDNQFHTKWLLEREDTTSSYLIYAAFPRPAVVENHLEDTILYSQVFSADHGTMIAKDLGIYEKRAVIAQYQKFFASIERVSKLKQVDYHSSLELAMMSVLCKCKVVSFEEILRTVLLEDLEENKHLVQLGKFQLLPVFWETCEKILGLDVENPSLEKLVYSLFLTGTQKVVGKPLPERLKHYLSSKSDSSLIFLDCLMYYKGWNSRFDELSQLVYGNLLGDSGYFKSCSHEDLLKLEYYPQIDTMFLAWMVARLEEGDLQGTVDGQTIDSLCQSRMRMNYGGERYNNHYLALENAYYLLHAVKFQAEFESADVWKSYVEKDYLYDQQYRQFYFYYDQISDTSALEKVKEMVENVYSNDFLNPLSVAWTKALLEEIPKVTRQINFYREQVEKSKERVVVIISDAFRYEVAKSLEKRLESDEKCSPDMSTMMAVLPSYTRLGMSALLPHDVMELTEDFQVLVDGKERYDIISRGQRLQEENEKSVAIGFDQVQNMNSTSLKEFSAGKEVIYVYHDHIDAIGDKRATEINTFEACEKAISDIHQCIRKMSSANNTKFIITADHGFLYTRDTVEESDKISDFRQEEMSIGRRYLINKEKIDLDGVISYPLGVMLGNKDSRSVTVPMGTDVFKKQGGGQNFVHGGASLQELVIPLLTVKTLKGKQETKVVSIVALNLPSKITNLTTKLTFMQKEGVTDTNKATSYRLFFQSERGEIISNEINYLADSVLTDDNKRMETFVFRFKNRPYPRDEKYVFVGIDQSNDNQVIHQEIRIDLAYTDDYGF